MSNTQQAMFGAGCFWGVEDIFSNTNGVIKTQVGYAGGHTENPTYEEVCSKTTGHAEVVLVTFDPDIISYNDLLKVFWTCHDPTQVNRQGPDVGDQYRTVIFAYDYNQKTLAEESKAKLDASKQLPRPVATTIEPVPTFYMAEEYHQQYFAKRGGGACHIVNNLQV